MHNILNRVDQRERLRRFIPCLAGQVDGCFEARSQMVRLAAAEIEHQQTSFVKEALGFRSLKCMIKIRRAIGYRLARQFPNSSSIFQHYMDTQLSFDRPRGGGRRRRQGEGRGLGGGLGRGYGGTACCLASSHSVLRVLRP